MKTPIGQKFQLNQVVKRNASTGYSASKYAQFTGKITEALTRKKIDKEEYEYLWTEMNNKNRILQIIIGLVLFVFLNFNS